MSPKEQEDCAKCGGHIFMSDLHKIWCFYCGFVRPPEAKEGKDDHSRSA